MTNLSYRPGDIVVIATLTHMQDFEIDELVRGMQAALGDPNARVTIITQASGIAVIRPEVPSDDGDS